MVGGMTGTTTWTATAIRPPRLDDGDLLAVARAAAGSPVAVLREWDVEPVEHVIGTGTTEGLWRGPGTPEGGRGPRPPAGGGQGGRGPPPPVPPPAAPGGGGGGPA